MHSRPSHPSLMHSTKSRGSRLHFCSPKHLPSQYSASSTRFSVQNGCAVLYMWWSVISSHKVPSVVHVQHILVRAWVAALGSCNLGRVSYRCKSSPGHRRSRHICLLHREFLRWTIHRRSLILGVQTMVSEIIPLQDRPKWFASFGGLFVVASILGPILGGAFVDHVSWRWLVLHHYRGVPSG